MTDRAMVQALAADGPHRLLADQGKVFDRFVGTWHAAFTHFGADGGITEQYTGRVIFGWILDGWAMQDVWISDPNDSEPEGGIGTTFRYFDRAAGTWRIVFIVPERAVIATMEGGLVGDRIVLEGAGSDGSRRRWSFNDLRTDSFVWRGERSEDGGRTWHLNAEYHMTRAPLANAEEAG